MARALTTKFRPYDTIRNDVTRARELASLRDAIDFSITDYITGPLRAHLRGRLAVETVHDAYMLEPARVDLSNRSLNIKLLVKEEVWLGSQRKQATCRFILSHEIGHIWLHREDEFSFSDFGDPMSRFVESEYFVEDQANTFADLFLLTDQFVSGFVSVRELHEYCDYYCPVPLDTIERRFAAVNRYLSPSHRPQHESNVICDACGGNNVSTLLSFRKCDDCGKVKY